MSDRCPSSVYCCENLHSKTKEEKKLYIFTAEQNMVTYQAVLSSYFRCHQTFGKETGYAVDSVMQLFNHWFYFIFQSQ